MDLTDIKTIKALLARHGFHFSKSMGQNFLIADWVPRDIAEAAGLDEGPEALGARVERVTRQQVVEAAQCLTPDTIYFLKGKEA